MNGKPRIDLATNQELESATVGTKVGDMVEFHGTARVDMKESGKMSLTVEEISISPEEPEAEGGAEGNGSMNSMPPMEDADLLAQGGLS